MGDGIEPIAAFDFHASGGCVAFFLTTVSPVGIKKMNELVEDGREANRAIAEQRDLVRRGYHANISHCPGTRRRANG
jgi:hypothetical protein